MKTYYIIKYFIKHIILYLHLLFHSLINSDNACKKTLSLKPTAFLVL